MSANIIRKPTYHLIFNESATNDLRFVKSFSCNHLTNIYVDADSNPLPIINGKLNATIIFNIGVVKDIFIGDYCFSIHVKDKTGNGHIKKRNLMVAQF